MNFTPELLTNLGINLSTDDQASLLDELQTTLQERVGLAIFDLLDDDEANTLLALQEKGDDKAISNWIAANVPEYSDVVQDEYDILVGELAEKASALVA